VKRGKKSDAGVEKKKALTCGVTVSATRHETGGSAHASWASWARPKAGKRETATSGDGPRVREQAAAAMVGCGRGMGCWASQAES
jgi:hypothetical protein